MRTVKFPGILFGICLALIISDSNFAQARRRLPAEPVNVNSKTMVQSKPAKKKRAKFYRILDRILAERGVPEKDICNEADPVQLRILSEYGSVFIAAGGVTPPPMCMFTSAGQVIAYQTGLYVTVEEIDGTRIELQTFAMDQFLRAREKAEKKDLTITPRGGPESARRSFEDTLRLWKSRFEPACRHWLKEGRLSAEQVEKLKSLPIKEQVAEVLELEKQGIYFNTWFNNSILYSVAAPGTSQHLSMLALDVKEFADERVRKILAKHGWFRTVRNDTPHFTFLGHKRKHLKRMGLKKVETEDGEFWIPDVD
jgi:hypothetical protein